jgi:hypothetical protein
VGLQPRHREHHELADAACRTDFANWVPALHVDQDQHDKSIYVTETFDIVTASHRSVR